LQERKVAKSINHPSHQQKATSFPELLPWRQGRGPGHEVGETAKMKESERFTLAWRNLIILIFSGFKDL